MNRRQRRRERRRIRANRRPNLSLRWSIHNGRPLLALVPAFGVLFACGVIAFAVWWTLSGTPAPEFDRSEQLPGAYFEDQGRFHLRPDQVFNEYNSNPPTSGPHDPRIPQFRIYDFPVPKEQLVHGMEHGGIVIWHNCGECKESIEQLKAIVSAGLEEDRNLIIAPYLGMEPNTIALTSWTRIDKFPISEFSRVRIEEFIYAHDRRFNPEGLP